MTDRYDFTSTGGGTGTTIGLTGRGHCLPEVYVADRADAYRPVEIGESTYTRAEARALAVALLAVLDQLEAVTSS